MLRCSLCHRRQISDSSCVMFTTRALSCDALLACVDVLAFAPLDVLARLAVRADAHLAGST